MRIWGGMGLLCGILLALGCKPKVGPESATSGLYQADAVWDGGRVVVCFAEDDKGTEALRDKIKRILDFEINQRTRFRFDGLLPCSQLSRAQIEVRIEDQGRANAGGVGDSANGFLGLFSHFVPSSRLRGKLILYVRSSNGNVIPSHVFHNTVVHEFGHALGLHHEQRRLDNKDGRYCNNSSGGVLGSAPKGSMAVGDYDIKSVMNYCNNDYFYDFISFSEGYVTSVNLAYQNVLAGDNLGPLLRCNEKSLENCLRAKAGEDCIPKHCSNRGSFVCSDPKLLRSCAKAQGGWSCTSAAFGNCRDEPNR